MTIGLGGKTRKLLITHSVKQNVEDRSVQTGSKQNVAAKPAAYGGNVSSNSTAVKAAPREAQALTIIGRGPEVDELLNQAAGTHFMGDFSYEHDGTELRIHKMGKLLKKERARWTAARPSPTLRAVVVGYRRSIPN